MSYLLPNRQAATRLEALAQIFDPWTIRHLEPLVTPRSRCWEVGAGGPSIASWLASRAAHVLATDIDVSQLTGAFEVRAHDVAKDPPPGTFDLIHARLVLTHVADRDRVIGELAGALAPGGWLVLEDADPSLQPLACIDGTGEAEALANRLRVGFRALLAQRGADLAFGRTLPRRLRAAGLTDVSADAFFPIAHPAGAVLERTTIERIGDALVATGLATADDLARHLANLDTVDIATSPLISAWGRRAC